MAELCLPHGWIVKTSAKYPDRSYYFNVVTGCSVWECPTLEPKSEALKEPIISQKNKLCKGSDSESEAAGRLSAHSIHTPEESPNFNKPSNAFTNNKKSKKRPFKPDNLSTSKQDIFKALRPPTAIVTPVIPDRGGSSPTAISSSSKGTEQKRKKVKATIRHKNDFIPNRNSVVEKKKQSSKKKPVARTSLPKKSPKKELTADPQPSTSTSTSNESYDSTDSDMALEFGPSGLDSIPLAVEEINPYDSNEDNSSDVEMTDVSVNLKSVEELVATAEVPNQPLSYYIVCDTNIFIHELHHIDELKDIPLEGCGPPHIVIPWVVFKELDGLKQSNKETTSKAAIKAVRFLNKILKAKHPRFHGQSGKEAEACRKSYHNQNDDKIIDCCQTLLARLPPEKVILMTNDRNLGNKAMIYNIVVHDWESLFKDLKPDVLIKDSPSKKRKISKKESDPAKMNHNSQKLLEQKLIEERTSYATEIDNTMDKAKRMLKDALDPLLAEEMRKAYGDKWLEFKIDRRLLREILAAYIKYWPIVFSPHFENNAKAYFELLYQNLIRSHEPYNTLEKCLHVLHAIKEIFAAIRWPLPNITILMNDIQILMDTCRYIFSQCDKVDSSLCSIDSIIKATEEKSVLDMLNHNWGVINELCGMTMDFFGVQHTFVYNKSALNPPESEYRILVADLYPSLLQLKKRMNNMLDNVKNETPSKIGFKNLFTALKELLPLLNIKCVMPTMTNFTPRGLERFCRNPNNRESFEVGCQQLDNFCTKLKEASEVMLSQKNKSSVKQSISET